MRLIFAGTPEPAVPALEKLINSEHEVVAVITRPDARKGRGRTLHPSPVKELAEKHGIEVLTPTSLKPDTEDGQALRARLAELQPECIPVVAYGNLITPDLLDVPTHGWVNLHFSLLPKWRGAAPVQAAIAAGDQDTGATTFRIDEGLDTGPILGRITDVIGPEDTADDLLTRLAYSGADLLVDTMDRLAEGPIAGEPQVGEATHAAKILPADAQVDWTLPAEVIDRQIRAHTPGPGAWTMRGEERYKVGPVALLDDAASTILGSDSASASAAPLAPGEVVVTKKAVFVGTGTQPVQLKRIQAPGKKMMDAADWARGALGADDEVKFQ